jgi:hypothetical protein
VDYDVKAYYNIATDDIQIDFVSIVNDNDEFTFWGIYFPGSPDQITGDYDGFGAFAPADGDFTATKQ